MRTWDNTNLKPLLILFQDSRLGNRSRRCFHKLGASVRHKFVVHLQVRIHDKYGWLEQKFTTPLVYFNQNNNNKFKFYEQRWNMKRRASDLRLIWKISSLEMFHMRLQVHQVPNSPSTPPFHPLVINTNQWWLMNHSHTHTHIQLKPL